MDRKLLVVTDVQHAIEGMNSIVTALQRDGPLSSDIIAINYASSTVDEFLDFSQTVVESLRSASATASHWLGETGDNLCRNLDEARNIEDTIRQTSIGLEETRQHTRVTEDRIRHLEEDIQRERANLESAQQALNHAKDQQNGHENARNSLRIASIATFFIPIIPLILMTVDATAMQGISEQHQRTVSSIESQLSSSNSQLDSLRGELSSQRAESDRLSSQVEQLRRKADELSAEARRLEATRATLAELSQRINDCLHTVNGAVSSSAVIATMGSMRNVVSGLRGVAGALGSDEMFAGPLAQLNDTALGALDRRVAAITRHRLTV
ncbi:hypothetical protein GSI_08386 [Ganoderma sinense ZZ0214-1]|uniref:Uncharacterized protein n=1 Tax=Ganoderma sinense ZZ0214-1 TaxID=1077348 RepID=A0A2G8S6S6_9APHY|nr:hypothetical protein GSI_08386 [Ganoderma sinense ZZ0214-1]